MKNIKLINDHVWVQVWDQAGMQVEEQVCRQINDQVWVQVIDQVRDQVREQVGI